MSAVSEAMVFNASSSVSACQEFTNKIKGALYDIANSFVYIGFLLCEAYEYGTYKEWGYTSIYQYASLELGFKKSSVNNFMNICRCFSSNFSSNGDALPYSMILKDDYRSFNYSQLVEMLSMDDKKRSQVTPDMTVKQIRLLKKSEDVVNSDTFQTSGKSDSLSYVPLDESLCLSLLDEIEDSYLAFGDRDTSGQYYFDMLTSKGYCICKISDD